MATEIEHKYLVNKTLWSAVKPHKSVTIQQAYLHTDPNKTIRIRTTATQGYITIKGKTQGASRLEYEYEIPVLDAQELIANFAYQIIEKVRHYVYHENKLWEVDEFKGANAGLIVAEIELITEDELYALPNWVTNNVTADVRYANANLSTIPYSSW